MEQAKKHAKAFGATLHVMTHVSEGPHVPREDFEQAEKLMASVKASLKRSGNPCVTNISVSRMEPGEDLIRYAKENEIDLMIIGIKKRSKVGKLVFGSTAQYLILKAPCPVVSVRE